MVARTLLGGAWGRRTVALAWVLCAGAGGASAAPSAPVRALDGVSCPTLRSCTATGTAILSSGQRSPTLIAAEHWNGRRWTLQRMPNPSVAGVNAISCSAPDACTAVGFRQLQRTARRLTLAERWHGGRWTIQPTPNRAGSNTLTGVSCSSAHACVAVGYSFLPSGQSSALIERWNGRSWKLVFAPTPGRQRFAMLQSVSCSGPDACTAVGSFLSSGGPSVALSERWNGRHWFVLHTPRPSGSSFLSAVSCSSANACTAVGGYTPRTGAVVPHTLAERWDGVRWMIEPTPDVSGRVALLSAVSCPSTTACTAVGTHGPTLAERWDGARWTIQAAPKLRASAELTAVSCSSSAACTAVGSTGGRSLAERWNGRRWVVQPAINPS